MLNRYLLVTVTAAVWFCSVVASPTGSTNSMAPLTSNGKINKRSADNDGCTMVNRPGYYCDRTACGGYLTGNPAGFCYRAPATGYCRMSYMRGSSARAACSSCACKSSRGKKAPNNRVRQIAEDYGTASFADRLSVSGGGAATLSQFEAWHNVDNLVKPIVDWMNNGAYRYGAKYGVYKRGGAVNETLDYPKTVIEHEDGRVTEIYTPGGVSRRRLDYLTAAKRTISADGGVVSLSMTFTSPKAAGSKRGDWSDINFQYWSEEGEQEFAEGYDAALYLVVSIVNAAGSQTGTCGLIIDEYSYWGTIKIWTGEDGDGQLGNCECQSSAYADIKGETCWGLAA